MYEQNGRHAALVLIQPVTLPGNKRHFVRQTNTVFVAIAHFFCSSFPLRQRSRSIDQHQLVLVCAKATVLSTLHHCQLPAYDCDATSHQV